jgi:predicted alpha/beta hydrolase family esterase
MVQPQVFLIPGLGGSGPDHWQAIWATARRDAVMLRQREWDDPSPDDWIAVLDRAVAASPVPVVLVAHSLGCPTVARWAAIAGPQNVVAALLVAPCDVDRPDACAAIARFRPMPGAALPFRSTVVASRNDPYVSFARAQCLAHAWGSALVDVGFAGHVNAASGLGAWDVGQVLLDDLLATLADDRHARAARLRDGAPVPEPCRGL